MSLRGAGGSLGRPTPASGTVVRAEPPAAPDERQPPPILRISSWSMVRAVLILAVSLVVLRVAVAAGTMLWWLAIGTVVAAAFQPAVTWLRRWLPGPLAIIVVIFGALGLVGLLSWRGFTELSDQFDILRTNAIDAAREIQGSSQFSEVANEFGLVAKTTSFFDDLPVVLGGSGGEGGAAATVQTAASGGSALFAIATFAVLMLIFGPRFVDAGMQQIDDPVVRVRVTRLIVKAYEESSRYAWLMAGRAVVVGLAGGIVCALVGLETPTVLGFGFAVCSLIPGIGIVLAAIPVAVFTGITNPALGIVVLISAVIVQSVEVAVVQRRIDAASVEVGPAPTLIAALLGLQLYGLGGLIIGLAVAVYGLAVLRGLTRFHDEVFSAVRQLVREDDVVTVGPGATVIARAGADVFAQDGSDVVAGDGAQVVVQPGADVVERGGRRGGPSEAP